MERTDRIVVDGSEMDVYIAMPEGRGPHAGVVVAFHRGGMDEFTIDRVDRLAEGVIAAVRKLGLTLPVVLRAEGTNVELGKKMLAESGLALTMAEDMADGARKAVAFAKGARP